MGWITAKLETLTTSPQYPPLPPTGSVRLVGDAADGSIAFILPAALGGATIKYAGLTSSTPTAETVGAAAVLGASTTAARADHVHAMPGIADASNAGFVPALAANTFPAKSSAGSLAAKTITDWALTLLLVLTSFTALTALLDAATSTLKGLLTAAGFIKLSHVHDLVADFGADNTGATDATAAFQAANDALAITGGIVYVPEGTYKTNTSATVNSTSNNITWRGAGQRATIIACNHATLNMFTVTGKATRFEDIRFSTVGSNAALRTAGYAVEFQSVSDSSGLLRCDILFQWSCIHSSGPLQFFDFCNLREYGANAINGACILIDSPGDRYVHNCTSDNGANQTGFAGIRITECASLTMSNCNWIHATTCLALEPANGKTVPSIEVVNSFFDSSVKGMAITPAGTGVAYRSKFTNCWFGSNSTAGVEMNGTQWDGFTFTNCDFNGNGIGISTPTGGGKWEVSDSCFAGNTTAGISLTASAAHNAKIVDNDIGPRGAFGANGTGITIAAGTYKGLQLIGNTLDSNTLNFVLNAVTAVGGLFRITDNAGINPRSTSVAPAVPASAVAATNNTGFIVTCYLKGGTITAVTVNGIATGQAIAPTASNVLPIRLEPGATISVTYTVAPTWVWITD